VLSRLVDKVRSQFAERQRYAARQNAARALISQSKLFDAQWYVERYPDVAAMGLDPLEHFLRHGAAEGRNPSDRFDLSSYLKRNPDVARSGINPLLHYLEHGRDEGRSIRAVSNTRGDEDFDLKAGPQRKKIRAEAPRVDPYPSDFTSVWRARPVAWAALLSSLNPNKPRPIIVESDRNGVAVNWLAGFARTEQTESPERARVHLFRAMRRVSRLTSGEPAVESGDQETTGRQNAYRLLTAYGLGFEAIADGWFAGSAQLMLRVRHPGAAGLQLRAFQHTSTGDVECCAEADIVDGEIQLISLPLNHELYPVLLTWQASDGILTASALLPFPSLFRGGLHHSELAASEILSGERDVLGDYMTSLTLQTYCWPKPDDGFAIKRIAVDLRGANGSETIFSAGAITALATQFGIELEPRWSGDEDALQQLQGQLRAKFRGDRTTDATKTGRTLILPADGFPSLSCLAARSGEQQLGVSTFCVVDTGTRQPKALVCHPTTSTYLSKLHHPALPLPYPIVEADASAPSTARSRHFGAPIMIRFRDAKVWKIDALLPLSPDTHTPSLAVKRSLANDQKPRLTVIIDRPAGDDQISLCLTALAQQTIADDLEILLVGDENVPRTAAEVFGDKRIVLCSALGASRAERLNRAASSVTSDYLLFLDATVSLSDPRTLALLLDMASQPQVASASCALIREDDADGSASVECAGYLEQWQTDVTGPELLVQQTDVAQIFPASTYSVVANDMRLCLMPLAVWRALGGFNAEDFPDSGFDLDLGLRARVACFEHYCTTLTRAAIAKRMSVATTLDQPPPPAVPKGLREQLSEQVLRIRRLR
jgi:GT2 family glycosyltransferase